jgi:hypothetical protein
MPKRTGKRIRVVIGGVDTHGRTHHAAVIEQQGRLLGDRGFAADHGGYRQLLSWLGRHGRLDAVGVDGTGSYGAGLTRFLLDHGVTVVEPRSGHRGEGRVPHFWGHRLGQQLYRPPGHGQLGQLGDAPARRHQLGMVAGRPARSLSGVDQRLRPPVVDGLVADCWSAATWATVRPALSRSRTLRRNSGG